MILIKALLELPLFYAGPLLVVAALTLRKRLATLLRIARQKATPKAATDAYNTVQEFTDPKHGEGIPQASSRGLLSSVTRRPIQRSSYSVLTKMNDL
jgi:hypothetical protein